MTTSPFAMREKEAGATTAEYLGVRLPTDYGDPLREYRAVRGGVGLLRREQPCETTPSHLGHPGVPDLIPTGLEVLDQALE